MGSLLPPFSPPASPRQLWEASDLGTSNQPLSSHSQRPLWGDALLQPPLMGCRPEAEALKWPDQRPAELASWPWAGPVEYVRGASGPSTRKQQRPSFLFSLRGTNRAMPSRPSAGSACCYSCSTKGSLVYVFTYFGCWGFNPGPCTLGTRSATELHS